MAVATVVLAGALVVAIRLVGGIAHVTVVAVRERTVGARRGAVPRSFGTEATVLSAFGGRTRGTEGLADLRSSIPSRETSGPAAARDE